jgi:hypothetical protein
VWPALPAAARRTRRYRDQRDGFIAHVVPPHGVTFMVVRTLRPGGREQIALASGFMI